MTLLGFGLLIVSLGFMLFRVYAPRPQPVAGVPLQTVTLGFRDRVRLQRKNLAGLGTLLVLGVIGRWVALPFELLAIIAAYGVLMVPVRYQLTTEGIALNRVVFRPWREFAGYTAGPRQLVLAGVSGNGRFVLPLLADRQPVVLPVLRRYLAPAGAAAGDGHAVAVEEGGSRRAQNRRRRLHARRS